MLRSACGFHENRTPPQSIDRDSCNLFIFLILELVSFLNVSLSLSKTPECCYNAKKDGVCCDHHLPNQILKLPR